MEINNKTVLIVGLIICSVIALVLDNHDVALAVTAGLVGYLSNKPKNETDNNTIDSEPRVLNDEYICEVE